MKKGNKSLGVFRALPFALPAAVVFFASLSCSTAPDAYARMDESIKKGSYEDAIAHMEDPKGKAQKSAYTSKNDILFYLDRGMINHYAGFYKDSSRDLEIAEYLIEDAFTKSISEAIGSYLLNDNVKEYSGEDYEDLYLNVFNSLNYYHNGDLEGSLVEIRRLNEKLLYLSDKYERAKGKVLESNDQIDAGRLPIEASRFSNSALARYLSMLFYRASFRPDDARIDYEELLNAYSLAPNVYNHPVPSSLENELSIPPGMGRLNVIAFTGLSPVKISEDFPIPLPLPPPNNIARLSFPKMVSRPVSAGRVEAVLDSGERFPLELVEDMGAVARETFKSRFGLIVLKTTARTLAKAITSASVAGVAKKENEGVGLLVGLFGLIFTAASEQADIRLSRYFPAYALVGGINLERGNYTLTINYYGSGGLIFSERREITVRERALNLHEFFYLN